MSLEKNHHTDKLNSPPRDDELKTFPFNDCRGNSVALCPPIRQAKISSSQLCPIALNVAHEPHCILQMILYIIHIVFSLS